MTASRLHHALGDESGFTLVELLVAMVLTIVLLFAILGTLDNFSSNASRQTRVTDANDKVRATMDRVVSDLRQAATIQVAGANDLVYTVSDSPTQTRRERICLDGNSQLWRATVTTTGTPATIAAGTPCPTAGSGALPVADVVSANSAANPAFRYDSATAASVRSVGLTFALVPSRAHGRTSTSALRASTFVRARSETALPVGDGDIVTSCSSAGVPTLTLSASLGSMSVQYTDLNGAALGSAQAGGGVVLSGGSTTVVANITAASGALSQLLKTIAC